VDPPTARGPRDRRVPVDDARDRRLAGTGVLYTLAAGLGGGTRASVVAAVGCTLGIVPHMLAAITGLAALLHTSALAFATLKYLGVAYLLFMAWSTLRDDGPLPSVRRAAIGRRVIGSGSWSTS
jgi:threonine/homoserine/homoserine lactone efflux protein